MSQENVKVLPTIGFVEAVKRGSMNLFNYSGKAGKAEFWWCSLTLLISFPIVSFIVLLFAVVVWGITIPDPHSTKIAIAVTEIIILLIFMAVLLALMHRRFHDTGDNTLWATATICLSPFAVIGFFLCSVFSYVSSEGYLWHGVNEFVQDFKENWLFLMISLLSVFILIGYIIVFIKTVKCLLKH